MNAQAQAIINSGIKSGHTHCSFHMTGVGQVHRAISDPAALGSDPRFLRTGFPVLRNFSRHAYDPVVVGVADAPAGDFISWLNA